MTTALVTGANRGIGLEITKHLRQRGDEVIAVCRKPSDELEATGARVESGVDVTEAEAVRSLAERLAKTPIDLLVLNAGILQSDALDDLDFGSIDKQIEVNALGPLRVASALLGCLHRGSKVALITSRMGSIADNTSGGYYGYRMSKAALNAAGMSLARDLADRGVAVGIFHPGFVRTRMTGNNGNVDPDEAAGQLVERMDELSIETTGSFRHANGEPLPW